MCNHFKGITIDSNNFLLGMNKTLDLVWMNERVAGLAKHLAQLELGLGLRHLVQIW